MFMNKKKKLFTTNEAADYLGVSRSSITNWVKQGLLGSGLTPGGHHRLNREDIDAFALKRGMDIPGEEENDGSPVKILLIDDDEGFREFVKDTLMDFSGYEFKTASDGMQGALLSGSWGPDLIILDIRMPNMDGVEFLRLLRADQKTSEVRVIVASAYLSPEVKEEIEKLGADVILEKPVRLARILTSIQSLVKLELK